MYLLLGDDKYKKWFGGSDGAFDLFGSDIDKLMQMFSGVNFSDIVTKVTAAVQSEQVRYSAPAYTGASVSTAADAASASGGKSKSEIDEILKNINKPVQLVLDRKVISEIVIGYQNALKKQTGG